MVIIGVDTGGTFTDFVYKKGKEWGVLKVLSTPDNPARAVLEGLRIIAGEEEKNIVHGTTVATNAVLEKKGAKTAFVTNKGFEDILIIGRQNREELYNLHYKKRPPLVPSELSFGLKCRVSAKGEIIKELELEEVEKLSEELKEKGVESVAVSFLFSFLNPEDEELVEKVLKEKGFFVSLSSRIVPEFREYERASTTVINAYVMPKMKSYVSFLKKNLNKKDKFRIMQSNGGVISAETVMEQPVRTILSGPAGGVAGAWKIGKLAGYEKLITFDMGGTSTDVSLIDGKPTVTTEAKVEGYPIKVPVIDIHTVGAGGGSIARVDAGGALTVGPESAGALPGPISYDRGGDRITITDANLFLGRLIPHRFLGGRMKLNEKKLLPFFEEMAEKLKLTPLELAEGILEVANIKMEKAIRAISIERGYDPKDFSLFSFGGAGGLHAAYLAALLGIPRVIVPPNPGALSALGMVLSDIVRDYSLTVMLSGESLKKESLERFFKVLEEKAKEELKTEGIPEEKQKLERYVDLRYKGQSFEITVPFSDNFVETFHREHERLYGYAHKGRPIELVNVRVRAIGETEKPEIKRAETFSERIPEGALLEVRKVYFEGKWLDTPVYDREKLLPGNKIKGPAILVEYSSTIVIPPFATCSVDGFKNLVIEV
jgi:N-methylhydantoinase A